MDSRLAAARPEAGAGQTTFIALAAREMRRFVLNPIFLAAAGLTAFALWSAHLSTVTEIASFGVTFVDIGGLTAMINIPELSWRRIKYPCDAVSVGQEVTAK